MNTNHDKLLSVQRFNEIVDEWANNIRKASAGSLLRGTHSSGKLRESLRAYTDKLSQDSPTYKVAFKFLQYGVFRAYGVGRGYILVNGIPVRGYRIRSLKDIREKRYNAAAMELANRGYTKAQINRSKYAYDNDGRAVVRTPLDWIDRHVTISIPVLADAVQHYYGDAALRQLVNELTKSKIIKKNG